MRERWRPIEGHPGYQVSDHGRVRSLDRVVEYVKGDLIFTRRCSGRVLKLGVCSNAYLRVTLGRGEDCLVHRLVGAAFVKGDQSLDINHEDGNRANNYYKNLEWNTRSQNVKHSYDVLGRKKHGLTIAVVMGGLQFESMLAAARHYGVNPSSVASAFNKGHNCCGHQVHRVVSR